MASWNFSESASNDEESWKVALRKSRDYICNHIFLLLEILNKVDRTSEMTSAAKQTIMGCSSLYEQKDRFVDWLLTRDEATFNTFLQALLDTNNKHIEKEINRNKQLYSNFQSKSSHNKKANNGDPWFSSKKKGAIQIEVSQNSPSSTAIFEEGNNLLSSSKFSAMEKRKIIFPFDEEDKAEEQRRELISLHESVRFRIDYAREQSHKSHKKGFIVVTGGWSDIAGGYLSSCHVYDIEMDSWDTDFQIPNTLSEMWGHSLVNLDGLLCIVGGRDKKYKDIMELQIFSASEKRWISCPAMPNTHIEDAVYKQPGILAIGRSADGKENIIQMGLNFAWKDIVELKQDADSYRWYNVASPNEKIYCFNGLSDWNIDYKVYDPANKSCSNFSPERTQKLKNIHFKSIAFQGRIVLISTDYEGTCEEYNPVNNTMYELPSLPEKVFLAAVATDGKSIFVIGGMSDDGASDTLQIYDYGDKKWRYGAKYPIRVRSAAAAFVDAAALQTS